MLDGFIFYNETVRKVVAGFGTLFNSIYIDRRDNTSSSTITGTWNMETDKYVMISVDGLAQSNVRTGDTVTIDSLNFVVENRPANANIISVTTSKTGSNVTGKSVTVKNKLIQRVKVPLAYGDKESFLGKLHIGAKDKFQDTYPRLAFVMTGMTYDTERKLITIGRVRNIKGTDNELLKWQYNGVPYIIQMQLSIMTRHTVDGLQILEQILPYFTPSFNIKIDHIKELGITKDTMIRLDDVSFSTTGEDDLVGTRKITIYDMTFSIKTEFFGPIRESGPINKVIMHTYANANSTLLESTLSGANANIASETYILQPDPVDAQADSTYGYIETYHKSYE